MRREWHAILAIDPGGTTGVAACHVDVSQGSVLGALRSARRKKSLEVRGTWIEQGIELADIMRRFCRTSMNERSIGADRVHIVIEDFVLRRRRQGGATGILDSIWVAASAVGAFVDQDDEIPWWNYDMISWQQPADMKSFATRDRLMLWDLYERGSAHKRDAWGHVALKLNRILG